MTSSVLDIGTTPTRREAFDELYDLSVSAPTGGMYPVGTNGLWHGGVHLSLGEAPALYTCVPGRIAAARLDPDPERATCSYGHTNFLLTEHLWPPHASVDTDERASYFMLYMHLAPRSLVDAAQSPDHAPWLGRRPLLRVTAASGLNVRSVPDPEAGRTGGAPTGGLLKPLAEPIDGSQYRWQHIAVPTTGTRGYVALGPLTASGALADRWTEPTAPRIGDENFEQLQRGQVVNLDLPVKPGTMLWWGGEFGVELDWADQFEAVIDDAYEAARELMGDEVATPEPIERAPTVHWEVFSAEKIFGLEGRNGSTGSVSPKSQNANRSTEAGLPSWHAIEDSGSDLTLDPQDSDALSFVETQREQAPDLPATDAYVTLSHDEKKRLHVVDTGQELRNYAVKYVSEWGIKNVDDVLANSPVHDVGDKEDVQAFQFWDEVEALPDDPNVWHYHPVTAMNAVAASGARFFVDVDGTRYEVERYDDVRDLVFESRNVPDGIGRIAELHDADGEDDAPNFDTVVEDTLDGLTITVGRPLSNGSDHFATVEAGPLTTEYGRVVGWKNGVYSVASDTPDLYEMLIEGERAMPEQEHQGVPELSSFDANVWAALSESEAHLKGINTWDAALVTVGPIQQTLGRGEAKGELQGALHTLWRNAPDTYQRLVGRYGLEIEEESVQIVQGAKKAHASLHGQPLTDAAAKMRLQRFEWVDRLAEAFDDPVFRYWMLREAFNRLERLRQRQLTLTVTVDGEEHHIDTTIGDLFRRDLSQALLLDWHINSPGDVWSNDPEYNQWIGLTEDHFANWSVTSAQNLPLTRRHEGRLFSVLLRARIDNMTNPAKRAVGILKYTTNGAVQSLADAHPDTSNTDASVDRLLQITMGMSTEESSGSYFKNHGRKVLSFAIP